MDNENKTKVIIELVSAGAVLLGQIFVGLELRQNQQMMRSQIRNELSVGLNDVLLALASNERLAAKLLARVSTGDGWISPGRSLRRIQ
jgi:hypothetical protein